MADVTFNGMTMEFDVIANMMDPEIKSSVIAMLGDPSEQELLDAYIKEHKAKFGSEFLQSV